VARRGRDDTFQVGERGYNPESFETVHFWGKEKFGIRKSLSAPGELERNRIPNYGGPMGEKVHNWGEGEVGD